MSEKKHTPGPWKMAPQGDAVYAGKGGDIVCLSPSHEGWAESAKRWPANAHLIAAAPEMLEALERLLTRFERVCFPAGVADQPEVIAARAAIKKARGEK